MHDDEQVNQEIPTGLEELEEFVGKISYSNNQQAIIVKSEKNAKQSQRALKEELELEEELANIFGKRKITNIEIDNFSDSTKDNNSAKFSDN